MTEISNSERQNQQPLATKGPGSGRALERGPKEPTFWYEVDAETGCWRWKGALSRTGYATTRYNGRYTGAHRAYYAHYVGPVPAGMIVMHTCDVPSCVNPEHLRLGTPSDNMKDMHDKGRSGGMVADQLGEKHHRSKLTVDDVREIRRLASEGVRQKDIAARFDTTGANVSGIVNRRYWRHVD